MGKIRTYATHFASIGGACYGLHKAGLECVSAVEYKPERVDYRERNLGHKAMCMNIADYVPEESHAADLLWTSPPCTRISSCSREYADRDDPMNDLYMKSVEYCDKLRPKYFILENVMGLLTHKDGKGNRTLEKWRRAFRDIGYHTEYNVLNSKYFGCAQDRERVFIVGSLEGRTGLIPTEPKDNTVKFSSIQDVGSVSECWKGKTYQTVVSSVARNSARNGSPYGMRIIGPEDIMPTITCSFGGGATRKKLGVIDTVDTPGGKVTFLRHPTVAEGARAQGFPFEEWEWPESRSLAWGFIGDAVSSPVAEAMAKHLILVEDGKKPPHKSKLSAKRLANYERKMQNNFQEEIEADEYEKVVTGRGGKTIVFSI